MNELPHVVVAWEFDKGSDARVMPGTLLLGDRLVWCKGTRGRQQEIAAFLGSLPSLVRWYAWLVREPHNPYDRNAVAAYLGSLLVGYVPAPLAAFLAPHLDWSPTVRAGATASCIATVKMVEDGARIVGLFGPWPTELSRDEPPT